MNTSPKTLHTLRLFAATLIAASPGRVAESLIVTLGLGLAEGLGILLLIPLLHLVGVDAQQGSLGGINARFGAAFERVGVQPTLPIVLGIYIAIVVAQAGLQRRQATISAVLQHELVDALRARVYRAVSTARWSYFAKTRSSDYAQVLTQEVDRTGGIAYYLVDLTATAAISAAYMVLAFRVSPVMTSGVIACGALLALLVRRRIDRARVSGEQRATASRRLHAAIGDHLGSMKIAKSYGAEARHADLFARLSRTLGDVHLASVDGRAQVSQWLAVGSAVVLAAIVYVAYGVLGMSAASLLLLLFLFARLVPRLTGLYEKAQVIVLELPAFAAVIDVERRCLEAAAPPVSTHRDITLTDRVELKDVSYSYREAGQSPAVHDINLVVTTRATTAIVGPSGSGKSTIADLLMGLLDPSEGRVLVDGVELGPEALRSWRDQIGYVSQDTFLFHDTVLANLLWAKPEASQVDVWRALALAAADEFVRGLPQGLDTVVGDRGVLMSGGERQRLSLARALLRQPRLLILDEATSSLDSENERRIQQAIEQLHEQITIVIITHRLSTIRNADVIHVIDRGELVESGSWDSLVGRQSSRFRDLCQAQGIEMEPASDRIIERRLKVPVP